MLGIVAEGAAERDEEENVDGDENREEAIPLLRDEDVLGGDDDKKDPEEGAVVGGARGSEREEFAQGKERDESKEDDRAEPAGEEGGGKNRDHDPLGADAG